LHLLIYNTNMVENSKVKEMFRKLNEKLVNFSDIESADMLSGLSPKYWVKCNNKDYLFKYSNVYSDYTDFGEVFTSYLSHLQY